MDRDLGACQQQLAQRKRHPERHFALLFIDLDNFKTINDSLGHAIGDRLLIEVSQRMASKVRASDTIARLGGDEFTILLEEIHQSSDALEIAERIRKDLLLPVMVEGHEVFTSASIGIVTSDIDYFDPQDMLRDADIAMYQAKTEGRAQHVVFELQMRNKLLTRMELENDLRKAIDNQELFVCYQPIVSAIDCTIAGFEALVRWQHPTHGLIQPLEFISVAEETGLIVEIDLWVLEKASHQLCEWRQIFPELGALSLNVNFSSRDLNQTNLYPRVYDILQSCGLDPRQLKLEITESTMIQNSMVVKSNFERLRALGVQFQIDDFGTGYSSLSYLQRLPIDALKIDRSFIKNIHNLESLELVKTMIAMAKILELNVVAEGVETQAQLDQLQLLDCTYIQGYFFAKPMPALETQALMSKAISGIDTPFQFHQLLLA